MGIRFLCPNGHKLNVKAFLAGRRGICPFCGAKFQIPAESTLQPSQSSPTDNSPMGAGAPTVVDGPGGGFEEDLETHVQQPEQSAPDATPAAWSGPQVSPTVPEESADGPTQDTQPVPHDTTDLEEGVAAIASEADSQRPTEDQPEPAPMTATSPQLSSLPDPLAETPSAVWYVRPPSGGQFGPAQADMMRGWLTEGRVSPETLVWREGWADWQEAGSVFPDLQSPSVSPAAPPVAMEDGANAAYSYRTGSRRRKKGPSMGLIVALVAVVLLLLVFLILALNSGNDDNSPETGNSVTVSLMRYPASQVAQST